MRPRQSSVRLMIHVIKAQSVPIVAIKSPTENPKAGIMSMSTVFVGQSCEQRYSSACVDDLWKSKWGKMAWVHCRKAESNCAQPHTVQHSKARIYNWLIHHGQFMHICVMFGLKVAILILCCLEAPPSMSAEGAVPLEREDFLSTCWVGTQEMTALSRP